MRNPEGDEDRQSSPGSGEQSESEKRGSKREVKGGAMQKTILVVEQDATLREVIASMLRVEGYFVLAVADGALALETAWHNLLSLVLLDPAHLQPDGIALCRQLRTHPETAFVPILMMVVQESEITQMMRVEPSVNDYIMKPLVWDELRACVHALVRGGKRSIRYKRFNALPDGQGRWMATPPSPSSSLIASRTTASAVCRSISVAKSRIGTGWPIERQKRSLAKGYPCCLTTRPRPSMPAAMR
jgi:DNA-binding response OmpR family regulator